MDLREIIKWFIPCFHILLKLDAKLAFLLMLLFCNLRPGSASASELENEISNLNNSTKVVNYEFNSKSNQSEVYNGSRLLDTVESGTEGTSVGRTFGRPMKKMLQALIPLAMAIGSMGTWAVVAALLGAKTLVVTLFILKLLLMGAAAKFGGLVASKVHHPPTHAPGKEIHLHIHNNPHGHGHEHGYEEVLPNLTSWSRDSPSVSTAESLTAAQVISPYHFMGPQTIRTPYGNYVRVERSTAFSA